MMRRLRQIAATIAAGATLALVAGGCSSDSGVAPVGVEEEVDDQMMSLSLQRSGVSGSRGAGTLLFASDFTGVSVGDHAAFLQAEGLRPWR
jgi:hypothetical protein